MLTELEYHLGDKIYVLDVVSVLHTEELDKKGEPIRYYVPRVWENEVLYGTLLNADSLQHFSVFDDAAHHGETFMKAYHKKNN